MHSEAPGSNLCYDLCQAGVAHDQPAPGCDPVGLVLKLLGVSVIKVFEPEEREENPLKMINSTALDLNLDHLHVELSSNKLNLAQD